MRLVNNRVHVRCRIHRDVEACSDRIAAAAEWRHRDVGCLRRCSSIGSGEWADVAIAASRQSCCGVVVGALVLALAVVRTFFDATDTRFIYFTIFNRSID